jgi:glutamyl-tRNA synthetase
VSVMQYRDEGYLPEALLNYLVRLGWSHGDQEIFTLAAMIQLFDLKDVNKAPSVFNPDKLLWLNQQYLKNSDPAHVARHLSWHMGRLGIDPSQGPALTEIVKAFRERSKTLREMAEASLFLYREFEAYAARAADQQLTGAAEEPLQCLRDRLADLQEWRAESIQTAVNQIAGELDLSLSRVAQPLRVAVSGSAVSPPIDVTLELLGRDKTLHRIGRALAFIRQRAGQKRD